VSVIPQHLKLGLILPMALVYMICMEMFGNGVQIIGMKIMTFCPRMAVLGLKGVISVVE
jgi:hypothetical protein